MNALLPELFTRQVERTPDAVAVVDDDGELTYAELDRESGRLAAALLAAGHGTGAMVGVRMRRCTGLAVAVWGIWKAGAAYVPLDPNHPASRVEGIIADTGCRLVLTEQDVSALTDGRQPVGPVAVTADDAAYVTYTSGSTGRPKGAVVTHGNVANRVRTTIVGRDLGPADRWLQKSALSFDASVTELFCPPVSGGVVVMAPDGAERDSAMMLAAVVRHRATVLQLVPSVLRMLVTDPLLRRCTSLRFLTTGGELLHYELCRQVWDQLPDVEIWNTYGPAECAVEQSEHLCDRTRTEGPVPIGRPIDGCHLIVVDDRGELAPVGVPGELWVGGVQVGRGYLGRPELTADRFVPDPVGPPGSRVYRSGDRVRWREDGLLEWLGRTDNQLKISGVRIEPAEVESALLGHPRVASCAVLAVVFGGEKRLVAYAAGSDVPGPAELRAYLRDRLPDYLIPTVFVPLSSMPLTVGAKIDRSALRAIDLAVHTTAASDAPLETDAERLVAGLWQELLGVDGVGADDDFFQLGGHSLLITRLADGLRAASGRQVEVRQLFTATTVRAQAELLSRAGEENPAAPREPGDRSLLSFGQQRLWVLDKLTPGTWEYVVPVFLRVPPSAATDTVRRALDELVARHEVLRTRYPARLGEPRQVIDPPGPVELRIADGPAAQDVEEFRTELGRGFDLEHGPVLRALLIRPGAEDTRLLLTVHHIAVDGHSVTVLSDEFARLCAGEELPPVPLQYADHAAWQRAALTGELASAQLEHWREDLADLPPLELPTDRPRAAGRRSDGAALDFVLPPEVAGPLLEAGRRHGATAFMTLLTAYGVLLGRYQRGWDFAVGTPVAGRTREETRATVGFFLNSLVLRNRIRPHHTFADALARTREVSTAAFANSDIPFERVLEEVQPDRDLSRTPLFQAIFDLHEGDLATTTAADDEAMGEIWRTAKTDLTLIMRRHADGSLQGILEYATALFDEATIRGIADNYTRLAAALVSSPDTPVGLLPMIGETEFDLVVRRHNDTAATGPLAPVHAVIAARTADWPDATAVTGPGGSLTFAELDQRANRIANVLRVRGVGVESVVAVLLDRDTDLLPCLLGIWKAGAAYVPMDPAFPAERVRVVLADSRAEALISDSRLVKLADGFTGDRVLLDADRAEIATESAAAPEVADDLDRLAYVIYTSGSTGRPKGVAVSHRGLANYLMWTIDTYAAHGSGGAPVVSSIAFDLGVPNLYTPLLTGQPVHVFGQDLDLSKLGAALADAGPFSFLKLAPAQLELIIGQLRDRPPSPLASVVCAAGDWVPATMRDRWREVTGQPETRFMGEYGPTEITVGNSAFDADQPWDGEHLSIGRAIPGTTMYVLDEFLQPVPRGVLGEICVGGIGVARGYHGNAALTADRFVPDPFGAAGSRLYRTGDLGRLTASGDVEFRGRADNQVKIRGYRVELGEIEAALLRHPAVREATLVLDDHGGRGQRLVAYCVGRGSGEVRDFLAERLPAHEVPDVLVWLDELPLTANGKVDRRALPVPEPGPTGRSGDRANWTAAQRRVAELWAEVLGVETGLHDDFFVLGGHSLSAAKLAALLRQEFGADVGVRTLFDKPTVAELAAALEDATRAEEGQLP
ncbi:non-ribosomal peptide synthetase [Lentzea aerocolonigenes]|uniref:non-ribosomal peptide synthetase n=1 Tax=Lentzea aerocolonigenes TaxID=68170 RepID=UPI00068EB4A4|nr:non-ribosomal peptide synthetase [Lentzea aerocolonigenes]MCP2242198.1 amino acid adenylation domain-containing protein [Lentzea aerocolonigenes]